MEDVKWFQLAQLLREVADLPGLACQEKTKVLEDKMAECEGLDALQEIVSWFGDRF